MVLDSSAALTWVLPNQTTDAIELVFADVERVGAWVPGLWYFEVANGLRTGIRRGKITPAFRDTTFADLAVLPIDIDTFSPQRVWSTTARLAHVHGLTVYDATYLELAMRRRLPLATLDRALRTAAEAEGIATLGL